MDIEEMIKFANEQLEVFARDSRMGEFLQSIIEECNKQKWIPVEEGLPEEHDSMFAKYKGTNKWDKAMFEKTSDEVIVVCEIEDNAHRKTVIVTTSHTNDGKWKIETERGFTKKKVIAWRLLPEYHITNINIKDGDEEC